MIRRSKALVMHWNGGNLVFENYLRKTRVVANPLLSEMLGKLENFQDYDSVKQYFSRLTLDGWDDVLNTLIENNILVSSGSEVDALEQRLVANWKWDLPARYFHFSTKNVVQEVDKTVELAYFEELADRVPMPPHYKDCGGELVRLPAPNYPAGVDLLETLISRRTQRWFVPSTLSIQEFSNILYYTWGKIAAIDEGKLGRRIMRTSPSGGCRHSIEVYTFVSNVDGIPKGIYHYSVRQHALELIREGDYGEDFVKNCCNQEWMHNASAYFVMTSLFERTMWRYPFSRAYRVVTMEAGHLGQTFQLVATGLGLHSFVTAVILDKHFENTLGLDEIMENALYCCAVGRVKNPVRTTPISFSNLLTSAS